MGIETEPNPEPERQPSPSNWNRTRWVLNFAETSIYGVAIGVNGIRAYDYLSVGDYPMGILYTVVALVALSFSIYRQDQFVEAIRRLDLQRRE